ncbi:solute carrier family 22 member 21-like [Cydia fagiglandana]|uniref:solute carrier family 22 member 21-like n=1 Tax=Cydia fagiglandana TaxID=1458189 RepID=UPI002FEE14F5
MEKKIVKIPFEEALDRAGYGLYSYINTFLAGLSIMSLACVVYGSTLTVGASACELQTTGAQQGLLVAAPVIGLILGAPLWGYLGDTRGRRRMLLLALLSSALVNALSGLSVNWVMMMILQFIASLLGSADYTLAMTLLSESVPMAKRNTAVLLVNCMMMLAQGTMAVIAIPIIPLTYSYHLPSLDIYWNSWRTLVVVYSLPSVVCACCYYFIQDSPKLTLVKGDEQGALDILRTIHRVNFGKGAILDVKAISSEGLISSSASKKDQIVPLFKAPLLKYTIIVCCLYMFQLSGSYLAWLPTIANRVIRMYETGEVADMNLCGIINADIEIVVDPNATPCAMNTTSLLMVLAVGVLQCTLNLFITLVVVNRAGRRNTVMVITALLGVCGILVNVVPNTVGTSALFAAFLLGYVVMGLYTAIAVALFPTHLRAMAIAITTTAGNITTFACIQLVNFLVSTRCELGFYLFASIFTSTAIIASFLPDDRYLQMPSHPNHRKASVYTERL